jgi:hypothetical protein
LNVKLLFSQSFSEFSYISIRLTFLINFLSAFSITALILLASTSFDITKFKSKLFSWKFDISSYFFIQYKASSIRSEFISKNHNLEFISKFFITFGLISHTNHTSLPLIITEAVLHL